MSSYFDFQSIGIQTKKFFIFAFFRKNVTPYKKWKNGSKIKFAEK